MSTIETEKNCEVEVVVVVVGMGTKEVVVNRSVVRVLVEVNVVVAVSVSVDVAVIEVGKEPVDVVGVVVVDWQATTCPEKHMEIWSPTPKFSTPISPPEDPVSTLNSPQRSSCPDGIPSPLYECTHTSTFGTDKQVPKTEAKYSKLSSVTSRRAQLGSTL
jgi:hypothetical protein